MPAAGPAAAASFSLSLTTRCYTASGGVTAVLTTPRLRKDTPPRRRRLAALAARLHLGEDVVRLFQSGHVALAHREREGQRGRQTHQQAEGGQCAPDQRGEAPQRPLFPFQALLGAHVAETVIRAAALSLGVAPIRCLEQACGQEHEDDAAHDQYEYR